MLISEKYKQNVFNFNRKRTVAIKQILIQMFCRVHCTITMDIARGKKLHMRL